MKNEFIFTRETAQAIVALRREDRYAAMYYAMHYGFGDVAASDKSEYADITRSIEQANNDKIKVPSDEIREIIEYLNGKRGTSYKSTAERTKRFISARYAEGYMLEDFKSVIDCMSDEWRGTDMERYLRPETLFGPKFEGYVNYAKTKKREQSFEVDSYFAAALEKTYGGVQK